MKQNILIVSATWHGQAREVAERIATVALANGVDATLCDAQDATFDYAPPIDGVVVVGSVHFGVYPGSLQRFVRGALPNLSKVSTAFVSVSGAAASIAGRDEADSYIRKFLNAAGWKPDLVLSCAGAIKYTQYGFFTRALMKFTSRVAGRSLDTSRDHVYTDWASVEAFAHELVDRIRKSKAA